MRKKHFQFSSQGIEIAFRGSLIYPRREDIEPLGLTNTVPSSEAIGNQVSCGTDID
jgi:hypothetical protein